MCVSCATAALRQIANAGAGAAQKPAEVVGAVTIVSLGATMVWLMNPARMWRALKRWRAGEDGPRGSLRHLLQGLWHLLTLALGAHSSPTRRNTKLPERGA